jgi:hypothetical protein
VKIEFQLNGNGELPSEINSEVIPQKGDIVEFEHTDYIVTGIRFLVSKASARIIVEIKKKR